MPSLSSAPRHSIGSARKRRRRSTALAFVLGGLLVTVLGLSITYASLDEGRRAALSLILTRPDAKLEPRRIIVAPFENKTGDKQLDPIGDIVADWLTRHLQDAEFDVVDTRTARIGSRVLSDIPRPLRANEQVALGEETGAAYTIFGKYYRQGDSIYANVDVIDVETQHTIRSLGPFYGSPASLDPFIRQMLQRTIAYLAAEVDTSASGLTTRYTSAPSIEVYGLVNQAWEHFFVTPRDTATVFTALDSAARLDSTYALPLLMKAYMLDVKSVWPGVKTQVDRVRPLVPEMSKLEKLAFELFEVDLRGDALARLDVARRLQANSPGSAEMPLLRVVSALYIGNVPEALTALKETDPTRGMNFGAPTYLEWAAATYHHSGSAALEERTVREELKRFRHHPPATFGLARVYAARNDSDLDELLRRGLPPAKDRHDVRDPVAERFDLHLFAGRELRAHGHTEEAKRVFQRLLDSTVANPAGGIELRRRARVLYEVGDYSRARGAFQQLLGQDSTDIEAIGRIATASIRLGDAGTARQMEDRLRAATRPFLMGAPQRWLAAIAAVKGQADAAVELLETAVRGGHRLLDSPPNLTVHLDVDFDGIEKTAAYRAMVQRLADASAGPSPK
jgi:TolB-like protein/tetratricopeptide (TPR) repeat protein